MDIAFSVTFNSDPQGFGNHQDSCVQVAMVEEALLVLVGSERAHRHGFISFAGEQHIHYMLA